MSPRLVILFTVVLDLVGFGLVIPLMTFYAESFSATPLEVALLMSVYSLAQFLFAPVWGQVSDRVGRRPVLLLSIALTALMLAAFASATALWMLFVFRTLHGAATANIATAQAAMADVTAPEDRAKAMGLIGAAFGFGFTLGPFLGGELSVYGLTAPIWLAAGLSALNLVLAWRFFPETRRPGTRSERRPISPVALGRALAHPALGFCILLLFGQVFAFAMMEATFTLFAEHRHGLTPSSVGRLFGLIGVVGIVVQGGLIRPLLRRLGERPLVPAGLFILALSLALLAVAPSGLPLMGAMALVAVGQGISSPSLNALISRAASADEQGAVLGSAQSMSALARVLGPALGGVLFTQFGEPAPFYFASALLVVAAFFAFPATARAVAADPSEAQSRR